jgi:acetyl esterase
MRTFIALLVAAAIAVPGASAAQSVRVMRDIVYATPGGVPVRLDAYLPAGTGTRRPAVVLIHGGGFTRGDKRALAPAGQRLAARGWVAFSVNYRLAPAHLFPAAHQDVRAAVRWIRANARRFGVDARRIGALGSSAGGNLAASLGTWGTGRRDRGSRVAAFVSWSGSMDAATMARTVDRNHVAPYLGCSFSQCPESFTRFSPISHVDRTDARAFLAHSLDERAPVQHATAMAARLRAAGVPVTLRLLPGRRHATAFAGDVWADTVAFLARHLSRPAR